MYSSYEYVGGVQWHWIFMLCIDCMITGDETPIEWMWFDRHIPTVTTATNPQLSLCADCFIPIHRRYTAIIHWIRCNASNSIIPCSPRTTPYKLAPAIRLHVKYRVKSINCVLRR